MRTRHKFLVAVAVLVWMAASPGAQGTESVSVNLEDCARKAMRGTGVESLIGVDILVSALDPNQMIVHVVFEGANNLTTSWIKRGIEMAMWDGYHAIFTCGAEGVALATMEARMTLLDNLGNESMGIVYGTTLSGDVASRVNWDNREIMDPTAVWETYWLNRSFQE